MNGGTISSNEAKAGGGIYVDRGATLNIYGGSILSNKATGKTTAPEGIDCGGGGLWINGTAVIDPTRSDITISNNVSKTTTDLGGGGIYVNNPGSLTLKNAIITGNTANGLGGGVASCIHGKVALVSAEGVAIYSNTGNGNVVLPFAGTSKTDVDGRRAWYKGGKIVPGFKDGAQDILSAGNSNAGSSGTVISNERFDGQMHNWTGMGTDTAEGELKQITSDNNGVIYGGYALGLTAQNKTPADPGSRKTVTISGNTSASHGGGIGCNGILKLGATTEKMTIKSVSGDLMLNVKKTLTNKTLTAGQFEFELLDSNGKSFSPKVTATNDANGNVTLSYAKGIDKDTLKGYEGNTEQDNKYTFYVREVNKGDDNVTYDPHVYKVVVNVQITESHKRQVGSFLTVVTENYAVKSVQFTKGTGTGDNWRPVDGANPGNSATFHNTWKTGSLQVKKVVKGNTLPSDSQEFTFTVDLTGVTGKVDEYNITGDKNVTKNTRNRIVFTLKAGQTAVIEGIPAGVQYNVTESTLTGYDTTWTGQSRTIGADTAASVT